MEVDHVFPQAPGTRSNPRDVKKVNLVNAALMQLEHPETFSRPSPSAIKKVKPGDWVKVSLDSERLWLMVTGFEGRKWFGRVANKPVIAGVRLGDTIQFFRKNIYDVEYS